LHQALNVHLLLIADFSINQIFCSHTELLDIDCQQECLGFELHVLSCLKHTHDGVTLDRHLLLFECDDCVPQGSHSGSLDKCDLLVSAAHRVDPYVPVRAKNAADFRLVEELQDVVLHLSDEIVVDLEEHAIFKFAILLISRLERNLAIIRPDLLDLCGDHIAFNEKFTDLELVFFDSPALGSTWEVDS